MDRSYIKQNRDSYMILAIDIGNTHIVIGCLDERNCVRASMQLSTDRDETLHEYAAEMQQIFSLEHLDPHGFEGAVISSVVPSVTETCAGAIRKITGIDPKIVGVDLEIPLDLEMNGIPASAIAGDLLATAVTAKEEYPLPAVIIDLGTATTITAVAANGKYIGGAILPGPGTALKGLVQRTSLLPAVDFTEPDRAIAKDTVNAMKSGIIYGSAGAIDGMIDRYAEELRERGGADAERTPVVLATGGMGEIIAPFCRHEIIVDQYLLLRGLGIIWQKNQRKHTDSE